MAPIMGEAAARAARPCRLFTEVWTHLCAWDVSWLAQPSRGSNASRHERTAPTKMFGSMSGAETTRRFLIRRVRRVRRVRSSSRASDAPRQKCVPNPNAACGLGVRRMSKVYGSSKTASSRFADGRSEEHTSELQSRRDLVCRLLLEKKNKKRKQDI